MEEEGAEGNRENFDLLHKFMKTRSGYYPNEEDEEIELSLGLSMNGIFGVDPTRNKKLKRSFSSIPNLFGGGVGIGTAAHHAPLGRTLSLPTETEEECRRRRKDLQSMRRMEARKKRMEKLKNLRVLKDNKESFSHDVGNGNFNGQRIGNGIFRRFENGGDVIESSQGSIGPLRSACSSASSDLIEGPKQSAEVSPSSHQSSHEYEPGVGQAVDKDAAGGELLKNHAMLDMPYVTTKENGPNGRKIQGYLYRYKKGEEVRIVCVCHGMFLTPKEFVEHGGCTGSGEEVEHPLKHIVVNPFPLL